jgi:hypothetical protein
LDRNLESSDDENEQIREAFGEFYNLFDELGIIDKSGFEHINKWNKNRCPAKF